VRYGARLLRRNPVFAATVVVVLAIGIGANAAMFSLIHSVLMRPLPFPDADRLVFAYNTVPSRGWLNSVSSPVDVAEMRAQNRSFDRLAGLYTRPRNLTGGGEPEQVRMMAASYDLLDVFQARPLLGRPFLLGEDQWGRHRVALLSEGLWKRRFGADRDIVGRTIQLNGEPYVVVGVMPASFGVPGFTAQVWVPISFAPGDNLNSRNNYFVSLVGRLKAGVGPEAAAADLAAIMRRITELAPEAGGMGAAVTPMREGLVGDVRRALLVLFGAVGCVLLITCASVANLQLARAAHRAREMAVRHAIGGSRARLVRQFLTESLLLSFGGGALGLLLAHGIVAGLVAVGPRDFPRLQEVHLDGPVLAFTFLACVAAGLLFGVAPALRFRDRDVGLAVREGRQSTEGPRHARLRASLVVGQVALALVLLIGAGLMLRSLWALRHLDTGFDAADVLTMEIVLPGARYGIPELERSWSPAANVKRIAFFRELLERIGRMPGARHAGATSLLPLGGGNWGKQYTLLDRPEPATEKDVPDAEFRMIAGDYLKALGIPIVRGRGFTAADALGTAPIVLVSQTFARREFGTADPIGKPLQLSAPRPLVPPGSYPEGYVEPTYTIVGVVGDVRDRALTREPDPVVYGWYWQGLEESGQMFVTVRTDEDPLSLVPSIRRQLREIDPDQPIASVARLEDVAAAGRAQPRLQAVLLCSFSGVAVVLACVALYGLVSYSVAQRAHEIGIRVALGAARRHVLGLVLRQGVTLAVLGVAIGLATALVATRLMSRLLFGVKATDPAVFLGFSVLLAATAVLASVLPARRALRIDPMVTLRND
jgi:putative ABC transport system permease protein